QTPASLEPEKPQREPAETIAKPDDPKAVESKEPVKEIVQVVAPEPVATKPETPVTTKAQKIETKPELKAEALPETKPETKLSAESKAEAPPLPVTTDANSSSTEKGAEKDEPKIVVPPIADALTESALAKSNWRMVRRTAETDKNLRAIHFVDSMTGWAAGDAGAVYRTTDGGRTWRPLLSGVSANINFVFFFDWNHGWMIGDSTSKDDDGETVLLSTINGGRTWMIQKIPNLLSVHFTDLQNGWAVGRNATLLRTTNGGTDWKPAEEVQAVVGLPVESSNYNFGFRDVQFLDTDHGWLIGNFYGRAQNNIGGLFVTSDSGKTWRRVPLTLETKYVSGRFTPGSLHTVRFTDENTGTVTGEMKDGESRFFFALHTRDGGKTWQQHRTVSRATLSTQFLDPVNGWMAAFAPREGSAEAVVYDTTLMRTDNGGMSWQPDFTAKGSRIRSVFFLSPNKGWAVGDRGMILRYEEKTKAMN
ncbi:MAG: YCF48-related protein, partial [Acidobacteriota bacterium]